MSAICPAQALVDVAFGRPQTEGPLGTRLPTSCQAFRLAPIALEPGRPTTVFASTFNRDQDLGTLYRSDNAGASWLSVGESAGLLGRALIIDRTTPSRMFMATAAGIHRSIDGGVGWAKILSPAGSIATDLAIDPAVPTRLLAGIYHTSDAVSGIYETRDSGDSWRKLVGCPDGPLPTGTAGRTIRLTLARGRIYASFKSSSEWALYRAIGTSCLVAGQQERTWELGWTIGSDIAPTIWSYLYVHPVNRDIVYATGTSFRRSTDAGITFAVIDGPHADHHAFAADPDGKTIYSGCDGGIYRSSDRGATGSWSFVGEGMTNTEF
jgi:hypothetical protein